MPSIEPEAVRTEGKRWNGGEDSLAARMSGIRQDTDSLRLGLSAFFPGGASEGLLHERYQEYHRTIVARLEGAAIEFELIGITLRKIADDYEEGDRVSGANFRVTEEQLERATEAHSPSPPSGGRRPGYQEYV